MEWVAEGLALAFIGVLVLLNPDIEIISLAASVLLAIALVPFGLHLMVGSSWGAATPPAPQGAG